jgi:hypothetical protein
MPTTSHQTVVLRPGRHRGPEDGACAIELASMLAGERFSDHPKSVCPVIAAFVRPYNDRVGPLLRNDLYEIAAMVVGTTGERELRRARAERCRERLVELEPASARHHLLRGGRSMAAACASAFVRSGRHADALAFVRELVELGGERQAPPVEVEIDVEPVRVADAVRA